MPSQAVMWHNRTMIASCRRIVLASLLLLLGVCSALAAPLPRLERERCVFRPPRGDKIECYTLIVAENRANPRSEVRLKVAVLKAKRPLAADPVIYLAGGPGDAPLVASTAGADPLAEGDWWNDTAVVRRRRDVIIVSQRGAGGSTPSIRRRSTASRTSRRSCAACSSSSSPTVRPTSSAASAIPTSPTPSGRC